MCAWLLHRCARSFAQTDSAISNAIASKHHSTAGLAHPALLGDRPRNSNQAPIDAVAPPNMIHPAAMAKAAAKMTATTATTDRARACRSCTTYTAYTTCDRPMKSKRYTHLGSSSCANCRVTLGRVSSSTIDQIAGSASTRPVSTHHAQAREYIPWLDIARSLASLNNPNQQEIICEHPSLLLELDGYKTPTFRLAVMGPILPCSRRRSTNAARPTECDGDKRIGLSRNRTVAMNTALIESPYARRGRLRSSRAPTLVDTGRSATIVPARRTWYHWAAGVSRPSRNRLARRSRGTACTNRRSN